MNKPAAQTVKWSLPNFQAIPRPIYWVQVYRKKLMLFPTLSVAVVVKSNWVIISFFFFFPMILWSSFSELLSSIKQLCFTLRPSLSCHSVHDLPWIRYFCVCLRHINTSTKHVITHLDKSIFVIWRWKDLGSSPGCSGYLQLTNKLEQFSNCRVPIPFSS